MVRELEPAPTMIAVAWLIVYGGLALLRHRQAAFALILTIHKLDILSISFSINNIITNSAHIQSAATE